MFETNNEDLQAWKTEMKNYEKIKRTKKPFGESIQPSKHITYKQMKNKQVLFNPVLQNFKHMQDEKKRQEKDEMQRTKSLMNHIRQTKQHERNYDIVNLHSAEDKPVHRPVNKKLGPIRNAYNVINNQKLPEFYYKNRDIILPVERQKNLLANNVKQYNIVTGVFNEDHDKRMLSQQAKQHQSALNKYWKTHDYDPIFGKYYDSQKQHLYQESRKQCQKQYGKKAEQKLPPSYVFREPLILDPSKPLPDSLQTLDQCKNNAKKRFRLKYAIQDEYNRRNLEHEQKQQKIVNYRVHQGRVNEEKQKQFDIITMKNHPATRAETLYHRSLKNTWSNFDVQPLKIKTGGFQ